MSYLAEHIAGVLALDSDRPAIFFKDTVATWRDLRRLAEALKVKLDELGLPEAAGVGCLLRNRPQHYAAVLGVVIGERCVTTLNPVMPDKKVADDIRSLKPPVVVAGAEDWEREEVRQAAKEVGAAGVLLREDGSFEIELVP